jgi:hypothetical protein
MNLLETFEAYADIAKPIIIKSDMLRMGIHFSQSALDEVRKIKDIRWKGYSLFSYDSVEPAVLEQKIPYCIFMDDGTEDGTLVQARLSDKTPYLVDFDDGEFVVKWNGKKVIKISRFAKKGKFTNRVFEDGNPYEAYVYTVGDDELFANLNKYCEYFSRGEQCLFCDLTPHSVEQKKRGEAMVLRKEADRVAEVLDVALHEEEYRHIMISGGTILSKYQGMTEIEWYCHMLNTMRERILTWYPAALQIGALDDEGWKRLHDTGIPTIQPNLEVYDKRLFEIICPGKSKVVGYEEWLKRTINAVKYWGPGNVNPNIVAGVEMAQPFGFQKWQDAVKSTLTGYDFFMSNGVLPRQGDFWCIEPNSKLAGQSPPPLEYYLEIGRGYLEIRERNGFKRNFAVSCRHCLPHGTEFDFEYFHGHTAASKEAEEKSLVKS